VRHAETWAFSARFFSFLDMDGASARSSGCKDELHPVEITSQCHLGEYLGNYIDLPQRTPFFGLIETSYSSQPPNPIKFAIGVFTYSDERMRGASPSYEIEIA
jgi:hypothetical protein